MLQNLKSHRFDLSALLVLSVTHEITSEIRFEKPVCPPGGVESVWKDGEVHRERDFLESWR